MLFARLAETSSAVGSTRSRTEKVALLAAVLAEADPDEVPATIGFLTGSLRQGAIGIGWATVSRLAAEPAATPALTVAELDRVLDRVAATTGPGSTAARAELLRSVMAATTAAEHELVRRILVGEIRHGALAGLMTDAVAKAAGVPAAAVRRAVMLEGDLGRTAVVALTGGAEALAAIDLVAGRPIQPMLASTAADVGEAIDAVGEAQVEWKLDGARIQVHLVDGVVGIYTRNLNDVTDRLGGVADLVRSFDCRRAVLDGEILGVFGDDRPRPFQETMSTFGTQDPHEAAPEIDPRLDLRPFFFDLMLLDDASLVDRPLIERSTLLDRLVGPHRIPSIVTDDADRARAHLDEALAHGHEGVMVKAVAGRYEAGRRGKSWRKVKPVHTLDLVVLAAEWGHGRRQGWLSNLHLGARDAETGTFVMVGKTFKGLTDDLLTWQTGQLLDRVVDTHDEPDRHVVTVRPELVVEIALDGVQSSTRYPGGVALRFARVRRYRTDKGPEGADTIDTVRGLR